MKIVKIDISSWVRVAYKIRKYSQVGSFAIFRLQDFSFMNKMHVSYNRALRSVDNKFKSYLANCVKIALVRFP